jgi:hypothetical protein
VKQDSASESGSWPTFPASARTPLFRPAILLCATPACVCSSVIDASNFDAIRTDSTPMTASPAPANNAVLWNVFIPAPAASTLRLTLAMAGPVRSLAVIRISTTLVIRVHPQSLNFQQAESLGRFVLDLGRQFVPAVGELRG